MLEPVVLLPLYSTLTQLFLTLPPIQAKITHNQMKIYSTRRTETIICCHNIRNPCSCRCLRSCKYRSSCNLKKNLQIINSTFPNRTIEQVQNATLNLPAIVCLSLSEFEQCLPTALLYVSKCHCINA